MKYYMEGRRGGKKKTTNPGNFLLLLFKKTEIQFTYNNVHPYKVHNSVDFCIHKVVQPNYNPIPEHIQS